MSARNNFQDSKSIDQWFQKFHNDAFETVEVCCIAGSTSTLRLLQRKLFCL